MVKCLAYLSHQSQASSQALSTALSASTSGDTCDAGFCQNWRSQPRQSMGFFHRKWWFHQPKRCLTSETCVSQPTVWPNVRWVAGFDPPATAPEPRKVVRFACFAGISKKRSTARRHLRENWKVAWHQKSRKNLLVRFTQGCWMGWVAGGCWDDEINS